MKQIHSHAFVFHLMVASRTPDEPLDSKTAFPSAVRLTRSSASQHGCNIELGGRKRAREDWAVFRASRAQAYKQRQSSPRLKASFLKSTRHCTSVLYMMQHMIHRPNVLPLALKNHTCTPHLRVHQGRSQYSHTRGRSETKRRDAETTTKGGPFTTIASPLHRSGE